MWSPSDTLLTEYLAGYCTDADARAIERWVAETPANRSRFTELRLLWETTWPPATTAAAVDTMWAGVRETMRADPSRTWTPAPQPGRRFAVGRYRWWAPVAAAAAIAAVMVGGTLATLRMSADAGTLVTEPAREYVTPRGQRAMVQLSDGTRLVLAPASHLRVPANYGRSAREVMLEGEAFFDVVHDSTRPFRVRFNGAVAEDIGTRFDVRAYPEDTVVTVAVAQGAVALGRAGASSERRRKGDVAQGIILRQGDVGTLAPDGRLRVSTGDAAVDAYFAWTTGHLRFRETPLPEVVRMIGRWYDLDIRIDTPALAARTITAEFPAQSPDAVVRSLALALDARVHRMGNVVTLRPKS